MKSFSEFKHSVLAEDVVKTFSVKGTKIDIRKEGSSFVVYVDNSKLEMFSSLPKAETAVRDFSVLWVKSS